jgi:hypothetical protein
VEACGGTGVLPPGGWSSRTHESSWVDEVRGQPFESRPDRARQPLPLPPARPICTPFAHHLSARGTRYQRPLGLGRVAWISRGVKLSEISTTRAKRSHNCRGCTVVLMSKHRTRVWLVTAAIPQPPSSRRPPTRASSYRWASSGGVRRDRRLTIGRVEYWHSREIVGRRGFAQELGLA